MINLRVAASFLALSWLLGGCGMLDSSNPKKTAPIGLISTPVSYYSTPKAKYLGTKYKENLDRLVEQIVRNPKTATLQFANNISSVGGIGFFTHSATKTSDERYLEVVLATPETFETKGEYSEKIQRLFSLYGFDLLNILNSDHDIYQDRELAGYGLNLAWRNVVSDPSSGSRVMLARAIIYLPKEKVQGYLRSEIKQNDLLADAVIFGEEEDGPLALVSYRPQDPRPDFRPAIQEDNLAVGSEAKPGQTLAKRTISQTNQKPQAPKEDAPRPNAGSAYAPTKPDVTEADSKGEVANAATQPTAPYLAEPDNHPTSGSTTGNSALVAPAESRESAEANRPVSSQNQIEPVPQLPASVMVNNQPQSEPKTSAMPSDTQSTSERTVELRSAGSTELSKTSIANSQTPQPADSPVIGSGQAIAAGRDVVLSPKPIVTDANTKTEPGTREDSNLTQAPQQPLEKKSQAPSITANLHTDVPQAVAKSEMSPVQSSVVQPAIKTDANARVRNAAPIDNSLNARAPGAAAAQAEKLPSNSSSGGSNSTSHSGETDLSEKLSPVQAPAALARQPMPTTEVRPVPEQLAALKKPSDTMIERKAITRPTAKALEGFIIQIAFNDKDKAQHWAEAMERRGYAVSVTEAGTDGALRVRLGNFSVRDEAERQLRTFKQEGMSGIIINLPQGFQPARSSVP